MVDIHAQAEAVSRRFRVEERDGAACNVQTIAQDYPGEIADVWEAVSTSDRIARWFLPVSGDLRLGGRYQLEGNAGGEILECDPPSDGIAGYRVTWEFGGWVSWVSVRLTALDAATTRFELEHTARTADLPMEWWEAFGPGATGVGWDQGLLGLALHLGAVEGAVSPEEGEAWALSDEGKAFTRMVADRWADAHADSGADREAAQRSADATYAFYTGEQ